jgi:peptidoglycan/xylan/chitin deacetylase (PgdA/CDA1 family)
LHALVSGGACVLACLLALIAAGCGDGSSRTTSSTSSASGESAAKASSGRAQHGRQGARGAGRIEAESAGAGRGVPRHGPAQAVPILMYHVINPPPAAAKFPGLYVSRGELEAQVRALAAAGFHAVTMDQMLASWRNETSLPSKPIVLSFDNGYQSQYTNALPVLRSAGWVGVENIQLTGLPPSQGGMTQAQIHGLVSAGWELDTQGFSHADLIAISPSELHYQVTVARQEVKRRYGVPVHWFCYPSGHYDAAVIAEVKAAGYVGSTTVIPGWATAGEDPYRLPRLRVLGGTSPQALLEQIAAARSAAPAPASYSGG